MSKDGTTSYILAVQKGVSTEEIPAIAREQFDAADRIVTDYDPTQEQIGQLMETADSLSSQLTEEQIERLELFVPFGLVSDGWAAAAVLVLMESARGIESISPASMATKAGKTLLVLEDGLTGGKRFFAEHDIVELRTALLDIDAWIDDIHDSADVYRAGDADALLVLYDGIDRWAIDEENAAWLPALVAHLDDGPLFAGLPARNLLGAGGLLSGLVEHGFTVTRLGQGTPATTEVEIARRASLRSCKQFVRHSADLVLIRDGYDEDVREEALERMDAMWSEPEVAEGLRECLKLPERAVQCALEQTSLDDVHTCG